MNSIRNIDTRTLALVIISMFYVTVKLTCNPLFFRHVEFTVNLLSYQTPMKVVSSTFIYPLVYVISDLITAVSNRKTAITIIIFGIMCDGFFSYGIYYVSLTNLPHLMTDTELKNANFVNYMGAPIWKLYYSGVIGTAVTSIVEILIFNKLYQKMKNFFSSTILSVVVVLVVHNPIAALPIWNEPDYWQVVTNGLFVDISFMIIYIFIAYLATKLYLYNKR
ncbi:MAG TPA: VUT family protein [Aquella sp.]|nr:VUT family protein [Aquella sp.]